MGLLQLGEGLLELGVAALQFGVGLPQPLLGLLHGGDVAVDPDEADDLPFAVAQRDLGGQHPARFVAAVGDGRFAVHQRLPRMEDLLLLVAKDLREPAGEEIEVGLSLDRLREGQPEELRDGGVDAQEMTSGVLHIDV